MISAPATRMASDGPLIGAARVSALPELANPLIELIAMMTLATAAATIDPAMSNWPRVLFIS